MDVGCEVVGCELGGRRSDERSILVWRPVKPTIQPFNQPAQPVLSLCTLPLFNEGSGPSNYTKIRERDSKTLCLCPLFFICSSFMKEPVKDRKDNNGHKNKLKGKETLIRNSEETADKKSMMW